MKLNNRLKVSFLFACMLIFGLNVKAQNYYNVLKYGAKNDSSKLASLAIKNAIDAVQKQVAVRFTFPLENT